MDFLAGHLLGDFLLQNRWLAERKQESVCGMALHAAIVTACIMLFTGWFDVRSVMVFGSHFLIDWFRLGKRWPEWVRQGKPYSDTPPAAWLGLIMDQAMHIISYWLIAIW